jgi:hypothetical protein
MKKKLENKKNDRSGRLGFGAKNQKFLTSTTKTRPTELADYYFVADYCFFALSESVQLDTEKLIYSQRVVKKIMVQDKLRGSKSLLS